MLDFSKNPLYIAGASSWFPERLYSVVDAIENGLYAQEDANKTGYQSIAIAADDISAPEMAFKAIQKALSHSQTATDNIATIVYNSIHRHGYPQLWCPASYLQQKLELKNALPFAISQGCNSQLLSLELISSFLSTSSLDSAIIVSSDKFSGSYFDRWRSDYSIIYGDAAAAMIISKTAGFARILQLYSISDPSLELLHRSEEFYTELDQQYASKHYDVRRTKKSFLEQVGKEVLAEKTKFALTSLWDKVFLEGNFSPDDVSYFIFPNLGDNILQESYYTVYDKAAERSIANFGLSVGHLGASDCIAGLDDLMKNKKLNSGDKVMCIGAGAGFSWSFMLIEII